MIDIDIRQIEKDIAGQSAPRLPALLSMHKVHVQIIPQVKIAELVGLSDFKVKLQYSCIQNFCYVYLTCEDFISFRLSF